MENNDNITEKWNNFTKLEQYWKDLIAKSVSFNTHVSIHKKIEFLNAFKYVFIAGACSYRNILCKVQREQDFNSREKGEHIINQLEEEILAYLKKHEEMKIKF